MMKIFGLFAVPLGYVLQWIYSLVPSYFVAIFLFTLLIRIVCFPLNIKQQKSQVDRARLAPRLERLEKKYANDRQKLQEKQQELYQKEGVSLTGGCLPMLLQMLVLMSIIAVIYQPLTYVQTKKISSDEISTCVTAVQTELTKGMKEDSKEAKKITSRFQKNSYYRELYLLQYTDVYEKEIRTALTAANLEKSMSETEAARAAERTLQVLRDTKKEFSVFGISLLDMPNKDGIKPNWLWLIAIASGVAALLSSILSMHYSKGTMSKAQQEMGGCSNKGMMYSMPIFSLVIAFTVPGGVALYWVFSNLLAMVQTVVLNLMFNPVKARQQAEIEYAERRRKKAEDKARLKAARLEEQAAWQREENEKKAARDGKRPPKKSADSPAPADEKTDGTPEEQPADEAPASEEQRKG